MRNSVNVDTPSAYSDSPWDTKRMLRENLYDAKSWFILEDVSDSSATAARML